MRSVRIILDTVSGKIFNADDFLNDLSVQAIHQLRRQQLGKKPILIHACPVCDQKLYISAKRVPKTFYFFKHFPKSNECPIKDGGNLSKEDLKKIIYNGARESARHKYLKEWLGGFLKRVEQNSKFFNSQIEARITSSTEAKKHWRQPDVSCLYDGNALVFELQLNNTFVDVISGREEFYAKERTYICWLFDGFDALDPNLGERDIFWLNRSNAFAITDQTIHISETKNDLYIECHFCIPYLEGNVIKNDQWKKEIIPFSALIPNEQYKWHYFDSDAIRKQLEQQVLADEFSKYIFGKRKRLERVEQQIAIDEVFIKKFQIALSNESIPEKISPGFIGILDALLFLKTGKWENLYHNFQNIKQFTNYILQHYPEHGYIFCMAVKKFHPDFNSAKLGFKLEAKLKSFWNDFKSGKQIQNKEYDPILNLFFPELKEHLT